MAEQKSIDEILAKWNGFDQPKPGQIFRHYKGGEYEIVATGFLEDSVTPCIVYRSLSKNIVWVRAAKNFLEEIEHDGKKQPRFSRIS